MFGRQIFFVQFVQYFIFLASITGYTLSRLTYDQFKELNAANVTNARNLHRMGRIEIGRDIELTMLTTSTPECVVFRIVSFCAIGLGLVIEVSQIIRSKMRYFNLRNMIDWILYLLSVLFLFDLGVRRLYDEKTRFAQLETLGCSGGTVGCSFSIFAFIHLSLVLAVAPWILHNHCCLVELPLPAPPRWLLWHLHPHVQQRDHNSRQVFHRCFGLCARLWLWLSHSLHQSGGKQKLFLSLHFFISPFSLHSMPRMRHCSRLL